MVFLKALIILLCTLKLISTFEFIYTCMNYDIKTSNINVNEFLMYDLKLKTEEIVFRSSKRLSIYRTVR